MMCAFPGVTRSSHFSLAWGSDDHLPGTDDSSGAVSASSRSITAATATARGPARDFAWRRQSAARDTGDWRVICAQQADQTMCALSQQQSDKDSRQLVMAVELTATSGDKAEGTLVLPFGLAVARPITLQVDEGAPTTLSFRTCVPVGCVVSLAFEPTMVSALRKGTVLTVKTIADNAQETAFRISLRGFGSALDRTAALSKQTSINRE